MSMAFMCICRYICIHVYGTPGSKKRYKDDLSKVRVMRCDEGEAIWVELIRHGCSEKMFKRSSE